MITVILGAIIVIIFISIIVFFMLKSVLQQVTINVEEQSGETILTMDVNEDIHDVVITAIPLKDKKGTKKKKGKSKKDEDSIVSKRSIITKDNEPLKITYKIPIKKIEVKYKINGEINKWEYDKQNI